VGDRVLDTLQSLNREGSESSQERVAVIEAGGVERLDQELSRSPCNDFADVVEGKSA
jgi:hypothetical protein